MLRKSVTEQNTSLSDSPSTNPHDPDTNPTNTSPIFNKFAHPTSETQPPYRLTRTHKTLTMAPRLTALSPLGSLVSTPIAPLSRGAKLIARPKRPSLLPQLVILSDGSSFTQLTTSPRGIYRTQKDSRNHPLWNPALDRLKNVEEDEAGRLKAFRDKFGTDFDILEDDQATGGFGDLMSENYTEDKSILGGKVAKKRKNE